MIKRPYPHLPGASLLLAASCVAQAQTNFTFYGRVVAGVDYQNNIAMLGPNG